MKAGSWDCRQSCGNVSPNRPQSADTPSKSISSALVAALPPTPVRRRARANGWRWRRTADDGPDRCLSRKRTPSLLARDHARTSVPLSAAVEWDRRARAVARAPRQYACGTRHRPRVCSPAGRERCCTRVRRDTADRGALGYERRSASPLLRISVFPSAVVPRPERKSRGAGRTVLTGRTRLISQESRSLSRLVPKAGT